MIKGVVVTTDNKVEAKIFKEPTFMSISKEVGGMEIIRPKCAYTKGYLKKGQCFVCDDLGLIKNLKPNFIASTLYGASTVVGNIAIVKEGYTSEGVDFVDMPDKEVEKIVEMVNGLLERRQYQ